MGGTFRSGEVERRVALATRTAHCRNGQVTRGRKHFSFGQIKFTGHVFRSHSAGVPERRADDERCPVSTLPDVGMGEKSLVFFFFI